MEELQVIETTSGRQFKPWASREDVQAAVQDPASITAIASEIASGKQAIASAINAKGGTASATENFAKLAQDIQSIQTQEITIDGGDMYAKQLYGVANNGITPGYWNLYQVMADLLSDARFSNYGGILLAEYFKGYDSIALSGAGAGGGYYTSDGAYYTDDVTHTWTDDLDGKGNRWVAYLFATESHGFTITDTNLCPRSIHIGRHVGVIESLVNGRISEIVVTDGSSLNCFKGKYTQYWKKKTIIRGLKNQNGTLIHNPNSSIEALYISAEKVTGPLFTNTTTTGDVLTSLILNVRSMDKMSIFPRNSGHLNSLSTLIIDGVENCSGYFRLAADYYNNTEWDFNTFPSLKCISITNTEQFTIYLQPTANNILPVLRSFYIGYNTNDKSKSISVVCSNQTINDVELQDGYCKPLVVNTCQLTENGETNNITEHILKRLKQDEPDCGDGVTITLGATNLAKLTSAESVQLLDDLTNIYGYTFA